MYKWIILGSLGLFLGMPNPWLHCVPLILCYPVALLALGLQANTWQVAWRWGMLTGTLGSGLSLYWLAIPVHNVGGLPWVLAVPCAFFVGAYLGIFAGFFSTISWLVRKNRLTSQCLALGLSWYLLEWVRNFIGTGFPWLSLSSALSFWPILIQSTSIIGAYGLSGLMVGLVALIMLGWRHRSNSVGFHKSIVLTFLIIIVILAFGWHQLNQPLATNNPPIKLALIQGNIDQNVKWEPIMQSFTITKYLRLSKNALADKPDLLIWPETAMPFNFQADEKFASHLYEFTKLESIDILFGSVAFEQQAGKQEIFNRAFFLTPAGKLSFYEKEHLVPFGEYLPPFLQIPLLEPFLQGVGNFTPGKNISPLNLTLPNRQSILAGILICYETIFPELVRKRVADGAELLINISNDAWFGESSAPWQHLALTILRCVEENRYLARSTNTGISALIDSKGRIIVKSDLFTSEFIVGQVYLQQDKTIFFYIAPYLPVASFLLLLYIFWGVLKLKRPGNLK